MKEITRIHLAKTAFSVEIDAKKSLEKYLNSIQKNVHADAEAMREIEARMVEILAERGVMKEGVISDDDVLAIKNQMGEPRDFSDDSEGATDELTDDNEKPEKQLMRDTDGAVIGGVCAGIAAYFNIQSVVGATYCNYLAVRDIWYDGAGLPRDVGVDAASKNRFGQIANARKASNFGCT